MKDKSYMPIKDFSRLTGIKRENLRYYDQIGLLSQNAVVKMAIDIILKDSLVLHI